MPKIAIAILTGGTSAEREIALQSARNIQEILAPFYDVRLFDFPHDVPQFLREYPEIRIAIPLFHGKGGEDGTVQGFLHILGIPFLFSDVAAHALALNKAFTKDVAVRAGIPTAAYRVLRQGEVDQESYQRPCVIKPLDGGSSIGVSIAKNAKEHETGLQQAFAHSSSVLVEMYIQGDEYTVAVMEEDGRPQALPVIAIKPKTDFFDVTSKYNADLVEEICPAVIPSPLRDALQKRALQLHALIGARHLTRSDFIVDEQGQVWFLEINTIPGQTVHSLVPKAIRASGRDIGEVFVHWINEATSLKIHNS